MEPKTDKKILSGKVDLSHIGFPLIAIAIALLIGALLIVLTGKNPLYAYQSLLRGSFGSLRKFAETIVQSTPLIFAGLAVAFGFTCGIFNIGVEGQLIVGAFTAAIVGIYVKGLPPFLHLPLAMLAGAVMGGIWTGIPALLKITQGTSEVISTIMTNWIAVFVVHYLAAGPLRAEGEIPATDFVQSSAILPSLVPGFYDRLRWGIIIAVCFAILIYYIINNTTFGYEVRAVGMNQHASAYAGINVKRTILFSFLISGFFAGLAGGVEIVGLHGRYYDGFSPGYGFTGIAVALLARKNPLGVILTAFFFGALRSGATEMQIMAEVPKQIVDALQGLVVVFVAGESMIRSLFSSIRRRKAGGIKA